MQAQSVSGTTHVPANGTVEPEGSRVGGSTRERACRQHGCRFAFRGHLARVTPRVQQALNAANRVIYLERSNAG
jgi:hypothetical protein